AGVFVYGSLHVLGYMAIWFGIPWLYTLEFFVSKFVLAALGYLCHIYAARLLAIKWGARVWTWYLAWRNFWLSFEWYRKADEYIYRAKDKIKALYRRLKQRAKRRSLVNALRRRFRRQ